MRITVVCSVYPPALAAEAAHAALLCRNLAKHGHAVTLITSKVDGQPLRDADFEIRDVMPGWRWRDVGTLRAELVRAKPDAVLLIYLGAIYAKHPMITFLPTFCKSLSPRPVVVTQFENIQGSEVKTFGERLGRKWWETKAGKAGIEYRYGTMLRDGDGVIALCEPHLKEVAKTFPAVMAKSKVIPAPPLLKIVDDADGSVRRRVRAELGYADDDFVVAYFGFIYPEKGVETVLEGVAGAVKAGANVKALMIGGTAKAANPRDPSYGDRMKAYADELGISGRTHWTGHVPPEGEQASSFLHAVDAMLMPFQQGVRLNNSSYAVVTSHGLPVITTRGADIESAFVDRENVLLFPPGDGKAAAAAVTEVATDKSLRAALKAGATAFAQGRSSWPAVVRQTVEMLTPAGR